MLSIPHHLQNIGHFPPSLRDGQIKNKSIKGGAFKK